MSSMVSGEDVIFETVRQGFDIRPILDAVLELWPDAVFQDAEEEGVRPLAAVLGDSAAITAGEFFVYKDSASADSWEREGWTEEHGNDMVHFLLAEDVARPDVLQLTLVIGSFTGEMVSLIDAVYGVLLRLSAGEGGLRERSSRVDWEADLRAVGYTAGRERFYDKVEELRKVLFPDWTADELACHPHEAQQFCEVVRKAVAPVPDHLVMKALMNRRRQGNKRDPGLFEPKLLWGRDRSGGAPTTGS
jgi:hypothetical protein